MLSNRSWAVVRLILGQLQIIGATASILLLVQFGVTGMIIWLAGSTACVSLLSVILFRVCKIETRTWTESELESMKRYVAEFVGTFALVFAGTGAIVIDQVTGGAVSHVGIALTFGLVVLAMIYAVGDISGAHLNPAVTLGFWAAKRLPGSEVAPYILSQCGGALLASALMRLLFPADPSLGATRPAGAAAQAFVLEVVMTWLLMFVILNVSTGAKEKGITAGIAVGSVIALEAMFGGPISGASMNPARSLAPPLVTAHLEGVWIYLGAPTLGALLAVPTCRCVHEKGCCDAGASAAQPQRT